MQKLSLTLFGLVVKAAVRVVGEGKAQNMPIEKPSYL